MKVWQSGFTGNYTYTFTTGVSDVYPPEKRAEVEIKVIHRERKLLTGEVAKPELIESDVVLSPIRFATGSCRKYGIAVASASRGEKQGTVRLKWNKPVSYGKIVSLLFQHAERNL